MRTLANFTPQQIEQFLQEFFDVVGTRQYTGARYVPIFGRAGEDTVVWDDGAPYEPLTVVMHDGVSYVSRRYVPAGIQIGNTAYWVQTYRFNAQVQQYFDQTRRQINELTNHVDEVDTQLQGSKVPYPVPPASKFGTDGQVLSSHGNGTTEWVDPLTIDEETAGPVIDAWLDAHPEATTTVLDNSVTTAKIADGAVTDAKLAQTGGVLSRVANNAEVLASVVAKGQEPVEALTVLKGYYDANGYHANTTFRTVMLECVVGDTYHAVVRSQYGTNWVATFFDANDAIIGHMTYGTAGDWSGDVPITVAGTVKVGITSQTERDEQHPITVTKYTGHDPETRYLEYVTPQMTKLTNTWWYSYNDQLITRNDVSLYVVPCEPGDRFRVHTYLSFGEQAWGAIAFSSKVGDPIGYDLLTFARVAGTTNTWLDVDLTVPTGANFMLVNTGSASTSYVLKLVPQDLVSLDRLTKRTKRARFCYKPDIGYCYRYKYTPGLDCVYRFRKMGLNNNFGMSNIAHIENTGELVKDAFNDFTQANNYFSLSSEWLAPYYNLKAVNNPDGDYTQGWTGGSHRLGPNNDVPTMSNVSVSVYLDGMLTTIEDGVVYDCDTVTFVVVNDIQACNTVKSAGGGRAVLRERQRIDVMPDMVDVHLDDTFLEDCTLETYYFAQHEVYGWQGNMWLASDPNRLQRWQTNLTDYDGCTRDVGIIGGWRMHTGNEWSECVIDDGHGIGNRTLLQDDTPTAIARAYGKFYSYVVDDQAFAGDDVLSMHCTYRFWTQE